MKQVKTSGIADQACIICDLLEEKLCLGKKFLDATETLKFALASQDIDQLDQTIAERQKYMGEIDQLDLAIMKYGAQVHRGETTQEARLRMKSLVSALEVQWEKARTMNSDCENIAAGLFDSLRTELRQINHTRQAFREYGGEKQTQSVFLDTSL